MIQLNLWNEQHSGEAPSEAQMAELRAYLYRCGEAYREQLERNGGQVPAVVIAPEPQNELEEQVLVIWMETLASGTGLPVVRVPSTRKYDA